jgi:uncharacterized protein
MFKRLHFQPPFGLSSPDLQMILSAYGGHGAEPPSEQMLVQLEDGNCLSCHLSNPHPDQEPQQVVVLVHGLGGSYQSGYLIRLARKIYQAGACAVRVNLRNCGSGEGMSALPYNGGTSGDVLAVLRELKKRFPQAFITLIGFSLGGNIVLKLAGELGDEAKYYLHQAITVCPTIDLYQAVKHIERTRNWIYHRYYLSHLSTQSKKWSKDLSIHSLYEFDNKITAPLWGYKNARDYYSRCSSERFIENISVPTKILFAADDPFIDFQLIERIKKIPSSVDVYLTEKGGHMGFLGWSGKEHGYFWLDWILMNWIFKSS